MRVRFAPRLLWRLFVVWLLLIVASSATVLAAVVLTSYLESLVALLVTLFAVHWAWEVVHAL